MRATEVRYRLWMKSARETTADILTMNTQNQRRVTHHRCCALLTSEQRQRLPHMQRVQSREPLGYADPQVGERSPGVAGQVPQNLAPADESFAVFLHSGPGRMTEFHSLRDATERRDYR